MPDAIDAASRSIQGVVCIIGSVAICTAANGPTVVAEQRGDDPIGYTKGSAEERPLLVDDADHPGAAQRGVRREPPASGDVGQRETCETQCEPDRGPPLGDVVVEIAEQLLVARVEVRSGGDQEQIEIDLVEVESFRQGLERRTDERAQRTIRQRAWRAVACDPHRLLVGHHEATQGVDRGRIGELAVSDRGARPDARAPPAW